MLPPSLCVCEQTLHPKKGFLRNPRTVSCPRCSFTVRLETEPATLEEATKLIDPGAEESWEKAVAYASIALAATRDSLPWRWIRAFALDKLKQYSFAISDWTACIQGQYRPAGSAMKRGIAFDATQQYEKAIQDYDRLLDGDLVPALKRQPIDRNNILMLRGMTLCEAGQFDEAEQDFNIVAATNTQMTGKVTIKVAYWQLVARYRGDKERAQRESLHT